MGSPLRVVVTGAAGQIGYSLVQQIAAGHVFGDRPVSLVLLDIPVMLEVLEGVVMELHDCAFPHLHSVVPSVNEAEAFQDIDVAFLVGAMPRKEGMERKDLLAANVKIFKSQGISLDKYAKKTVKAIVVGNPANTNAFICAKYAASIPSRNISAMTRLDHNRACAQIGLKVNVPNSNVRNMIIWGNHSSTQFPDVSQAQVMDKGGAWVPAMPIINDEAWVKGPFIPLIQKRGGEVIKKRKLSSAMSAAKAACDHVKDWFAGTAPGVHVSMVVPSDGSYGIPKDIMYSFPVQIKNGEWEIVQGLPTDDFAKEKMLASLKELEEERDEALKACEA